MNWIKFIKENKDILNSYDELEKKIDKLILNGVDLDEIDDDGYNAIALASEERYLTLIKVLLEKGADFNSRDKYGYKLVNRVYLYFYYYYDVLKLLLEYDLDPNSIQDSYRNNTILHMTVYDGNLESTKLLLDYGANINAKNKYGLTPFNYAISDFYPPIARNIIKVLKFLASNPNLNVEDNFPLHYASTLGSPEIIEILIDRGIDVNIRNDFNTTPLHRASESWSLKSIKLLLSKGADINCRDNSGGSVIHYAAQFFNFYDLEVSKDDPNYDDIISESKERIGDPETIPFLINKGFSINDRDNNNNTPLHYAAEGGSLEAVKILVKNGADINAVNNDGLKPIDMVKPYEEEIKKYLLTFNKKSVDDIIYQLFLTMYNEKLNKN